LKIRSRACTTGKARSTVLPNVPTVIETGISGYEATIWLGLMARRNAEADHRQDQRGGERRDQAGRIS